MSPARQMGYDTVFKINFSIYSASFTQPIQYNSTYTTFFAISPPLLGKITGASVMSLTFRRNIQNFAAARCETGSHCSAISCAATFLSRIPRIWSFAETSRFGTHLRVFRSLLLWYDCCDCPVCFRRFQYSIIEPELAQSLVAVRFLRSQSHKLYGIVSFSKGDWAGNIMNSYPMVIQ